MSEKNIDAKPENVAKEQATKEQGKPGILAKLPRPLAETIVGVATVALVAGCGSGYRAQDDTREDNDTVQLETYEDTASEEELDGVESDVPDVLDDEVTDVVEEDAAEEDAVEEDAVEEDAVEEDAVTDVPAEDVEEEDAVEEDAPVDTVDAEADTPVDVEVDDVVSDDVTATCSPVDGMADVWISAGSTETVGGIGVRYNGQDMFGNGLYDIVCGDVTVRSGIAAAPLTSELVDVPEHSFSVTLRPNTVSSIRSNVTVTVDAY